MRNEGAHMGDEDAHISNVWRAAAACFLVAAASGALLRIGALTGLPWGLEAGNLRHAHSHLMSFSWVTPAIMALWMSDRARFGAVSVATGRVAAIAALTLGLSSFPFFLVAGYGRVNVFGAPLPVASMLSGVTMIAWYLFGAWHLRARRQLHRSRSLRLFDVSLIGLGLSTVGAWSRAALQAAGAANPALAEIAVQLFLGAFTHGWLIVATLALAWASIEKTALEAGDERAADIAWVLLLLGLPGASLAGTLGSGTLGPGTLGPGTLGQGTLGPPGQAMWAGMAPLIRLGTSLFGLGVAWCAWRLGRVVIARRRWIWAPFLVYLVLVVAGLLGFSLPAVAGWAERMGLRIVYLHIVTLGVASTGLLVAARERWGRGVAPSPWSFGALTLLLLLGIVSLTPLWPAAVSASWRQGFAAWTSIPPILAMVKSVLPNRSLRSGKDISRASR